MESNDVETTTGIRQRLMEVRNRSGIRTLVRMLVPNLGTLIILGLFMWVTAAGALPMRAPLNEITTFPTMINFQGRLTDPAGQPIDGPTNMIFTLYEQASSGPPLWSEEWTEVNAVPVSNGLFNVLLGSQSGGIPFDVLNRDTLYLGITVPPDPEMTPRERLTSVPYALVANSANTVPDAAITTSKLVDGAVTEAKIADGSITSTKLVPGLRTKILTIPMFPNGYEHTQDWGDGVVLGNGGSSEATGSIVLPADFPTTDTYVTMRIVFNSSDPSPWGIVKLRVAVKAQDFGHNNSGYDAFDVWNVEDRAFTRGGSDPWLDPSHSDRSQRRLWGETITLNSSYLRPGKWLSVWIKRLYDDPQDDYPREVILRAVVLEYPSSAN